MLCIKKSIHVYLPLAKHLHVVFVNILYTVLYALEVAQIVNTYCI